MVGKWFISLVRLLYLLELGWFLLKGRTIDYFWAFNKSVQRLVEYSVNISQVGKYSFA
jgi:hypothetical protein